MSDGGSEFVSAKTQFGNVFTDMVTSMGLIYKQAPRRTCVHVEEKNKDIRQAINSRLHASGSLNWVIFPAIIKRMNTVEHNESESKKKPGREEYKKDVSEAVQDAIKKSKPRKKRWKKSKYDEMSAKEMYQLVKQKRDMILQKKGIPAKIPRGKKALIEICRKIKA